LKTIPAIDEIENGNIDREFEIYISTELNREEIEAIIRSSVEIEEFSVAEIKVAQSGRNGDEQKLLTRSPTKENEGKNLKYRKPGTVKIETHVLDSLIDIVREIFIKKNQLKDIAGSLHSDEATESVNQLEKLVQKLYHRSMTLRLVPISLLTDMLPRVSRELLLKSRQKDWDYNRGHGTSPWTVPLLKSWVTRSFIWYGILSTTALKHRGADQGRQT